MHLNEGKIREWARNIDYDAEKMFNKFFNDDIQLLRVKMNLEQGHYKPIPTQFFKQNTRILADMDESRELTPWTLPELQGVFVASLNELRQKMTTTQIIIDENDINSLDFIAACANLRAYIFHIIRKSSLEIKRNIFKYLFPPFFFIKH